MKIPLYKENKAKIEFLSRSYIIAKIIPNGLKLDLYPLVGIETKE
jgi:hypothetical protein